MLPAYILVVDKASMNWTSQLQAFTADERKFVYYGIRAGNKDIGSNSPSICAKETTFARRIPFRKIKRYIGGYQAGL